MKFLVAIDSSPSHYLVLEKTLALAAPSHADVVLLTVIEPISSYYSTVLLPTGDWLDWQGVPDLQLEITLKDKAKELLDSATKELSNGGVACRTRMEVGNPRDMICKIAHEEAPDFLVLGSRGLGQLERMLLGSVSDYVVHHCPCPTIVVR